jgi:hypothetical protein
MGAPALELEIRQVSLSSVTGSYISFSDTFIKYPYVNIVLIPGLAGQDNVNAFISNVSISGFDLEFSDVFTGYVHYMAARSE